MPLEKSAAPKKIGRNIAEMEAAGHPPAQSVAAALSTARKAWLAHHKGGSLPKRLRKK
jgi:hypothetical protein